MLRYFAEAPARPEPAFPELTDREREVLEPVARSTTNQAIARRLRIAPKTVRNHASNILTKLQAADRAEVILRARAAGLGQQLDSSGQASRT